MNLVRVIEFGTVVVVALALGALAGARVRPARRMSESPTESPDPGFALLRETTGILESAADPSAALQSLARRLCASSFDACIIELESDRTSTPLQLAVCSDGDLITGNAHRHNGPILPHAGEMMVRSADEVAEDPALATLFGQPRRGALIVLPVSSRGRRLGTMALGIPAGHPSAGQTEIALEIATRVGGYAHRLRLEQEAASAQQVKSDFLAVMSHELKTPLNIVLGYTDLLLMGLPTPIPDEARANVERLRASARDLMVRLEDILNFARMDDEPEDALFADVDAAAAVRDVAISLRPLAEQRSLAFAIDTGESVMVSTDAARVGQIAFNLIANAIRFTHAGSITVAVHARPDGGAVIAISDTGIGIAPEHLEQIYEPFWQVNRSATRTVGGLGLGLAIARHLANSIGATLDVSSHAGQGTTFSLELPPAAEDVRGTRGA